MFKVKAVACAAAFGILLTGCASANQGGSTTCKAFKAMSSSDQTDVITKYLKDKSKNPSNGEITLTKLSAKAFCATAGRDTDPISKIETG